MELKLPPEYTREEISEAQERIPAEWVIKHFIKNEVGFPIEFTKRKFLRAIYNDLSPYQVILKAPQVGMTVCNTLKAFYIADRFKRQIIYTLPTQSDVEGMVGGSFNRIIAQNPILMDLVKDHDTVEQKQVGQAMIFYRGTWSAKQAMMVPSGLNIHDEVDASNPQVITQYENRLQAQEDGGWRWYFSHPSLAGHGVDIYWQQSDKKEWFIRCPHCTHEQYLEWPENIDMEKEIYICSLCKKELPDEVRINGVWRKTTEGEFSGYHISQLMLYNKSAKDILKAYRDPMKDKQYFYNFVLGLPFVASDDRIEPSIVLKNCVDVVNEQLGINIIGADTGHGIHYVVMNKDGVFFYDHETEITATKDPYDAIRTHLKRWLRSRAVFDQGGDLIGVRKLQAEFPGRVFLCFYVKDKKTTEPYEWGTGDKYGEVHVQRNRMMTLIVEQMRDIGRFRLNGTKDEWAEFASHFGNIYREKILVKEVKDKDDKSLYGNEYVWKRNGADHFCHALLYAIVGLQKYGGEMAKIVGGNDPWEGVSRGKIVEVVNGKDMIRMTPQDVRGNRVDL